MRYEEAYEELVQVKVNELIELSKTMNMADFRYICFEDGADTILGGCITRRGETPTPYGIWLDKYADLLTS